MSGEEFKEKVAKLGLTNEEVSKRLEISLVHVFRLYKKAQVDNYYVERLLKGSTNKMLLPDEKKVPLYDIDATAGNVTVFNEEAPEYVKQYITVPAFSDCDMFIGVSGHSMYPKYCSGELIALKKIEDFDIVAYGEAYLIVTGEQRLLKFIKKGSDKDHWLLTSENPDFDSFEISKRKVLHLYIVKGKITKNII